MFFFCVIITVSAIGLIWFGSFENNLFTLLNPDEETAKEFYAIAPSGPAAEINSGIQSASLFQTIGNSFNDLKASIGNLFNSNQSDNTQKNVELQVNQKVYQLPLAQPKK